MGDARADELPETILGPEHKSLPPSSWGLAQGDFLAREPRLSEFTTPVFALDRAALDHNLDTMARWCADRGLDHAPHGKTSMSPQLWREQLVRGAWGISLATIWQVQVARRWGLDRIVLANQLVDPVGLRWAAAELLADPAFELYCWVDGPRQLDLMTQVLDERNAERPLRVLVELGADGGRTGARSADAALDLARRIQRSPGLELAGVGGYEGALSGDRSEAGVRRVREYLAALGDLHRQVDAAGLYAGRAVVTAGGSAFFDLVAQECGGLVDPDGTRGTPTRVVLRSGAYLVHDAGHYARLSPFEQPGSTATLRAAMHAWTRVLSHPEPGLYLADVGRRDVPFDIDLPVPERVPGRPDVDLSGARVTALNDQHAFVRHDAPDDGPARLDVGDVVRLGLSHPCTAFDKWELVPVVADADADDPVVVDLVRLYF